MSDVNEMRFSPLDDIHERRVKVMRLRWVQHFSVSQIAQILGEGERTIYRDLAAIRKVNDSKRKKGGIKINTNAVLAQLQAAHAERQRERWQEYHNNKKDNALRRRLLDDIHRDEETHIKLLQSMGIIDKAAENMNINATTETWAERIQRLKREREEALREDD